MNILACMVILKTRPLLLVSRPATSKGFRSGYFIIEGEIDPSSITLDQAHRYSNIGLHWIDTTFANNVHFAAFGVGAGFELIINEHGKRKSHGEAAHLVLYIFWNGWRFRFLIYVVRRIGGFLVCFGDCICLKSCVRASIISLSSHCFIYQDVYISGSFIFIMYLFKVFKPYFLYDVYYICFKTSDFLYLEEAISGFIKIEIETEESR